MSVDPEFYKVSVTIIMPRSNLRATITACLDKEMTLEEADKRMRELRSTQEAVGNIVIGYAVQVNEEIEEDDQRDEFGKFVE